MLIEDIRRSIPAIFNNPLQVEVCLKILDYLTNTKCEQLQMLTYASLSKICGYDTISAEIISAATLLSGDKYHILETGFLFIDINDEEFEVSKTDLNEAVTSGYLIHPITGEFIDDFLSHTIVFFYPSKNLKKADCR